MFICRLRLAQPLATEKENAEQLLLLNCLFSEKQEHRFLLLQCQVLPENLCSTLFTTGYKRLTEAGCEAFAFGFFCFEAFAFGFWAFGFFGV
jgi:hypothetical protein